MIDYDKIRNENKVSNNTVGNEEDSDTSIINQRHNVIDINVFKAFPFNQIALEDDSNPFANLDDSIPDDTSSDDMFDDESDDDGGSVFDDSNDDPFGSDDSGIFGDSDDGGEEGSGGKKTAIPILDRQKAIKEKFDLSKIIRKDFPGYIYSLQSIIKTSIDILERRNVEKEMQKAKEKVISQYRETLASIEEYISVIDNEKYEDIFTMYVQFWTVLNKLKPVSEKIMM